MIEAFGGEFISPASLRREVSPLWETLMGMISLCEILNSGVIIRTEMVKRGNKMKIWILADNHVLVDQCFLGEAGASYYIEADGKRYLFDTGRSDVFLRNAAMLGISLTGLDAVILSHGHYDHTHGLPELCRLYCCHDCGRPELIAHPQAFAPRQTKMKFMGSLMREADLHNFFSLHLTKEPLWLSDRLVFLGEIARNNDFEAQRPIGKIEINGSWERDYVMDDSALAYKTEDGLVIITGCSHAGICNIVAQAQRVCGESRICSILGGFHLLQAGEERMQKTNSFLAAQHPGKVYACHCTDQAARIGLAGALPLGEAGAGMLLEF